MRVIWLMLLLISNCGYAETERITTDELQLGLSIGYGGREVPLRGEDNIVIPVIAHIQYYSDDWYFDNFSLGYSLYENETVLIDLVGTFNNDGFYFELDGITRFLAEPTKVRDPIRPNETPPPDFVYSNSIDRELSYLGGIGITLPFPKTVLSAGVFTDVSGVHYGDEARLSVLQEEIQGRWQFSLELGATYKSAEIANYYYMPQLGEFLARIPQRTLSELTNYHVKFSTKYWLSEQLSLGALLSYEKLDNELKQSPVVDQVELVSGFVGVTKWF